MNAYAFLRTAIAPFLTVLVLLGSASLGVHAREPSDTVRLQVVAGTDRPFIALTGEAGLPSGNVYGIAQDTQGFLWFATGDGLSRYDGYAFRNFRFDRNNPNSLGHNTVVSIQLGHGGVLWLGTTGAGVDRFDPATETFTHYRHDPRNPSSLSSNSISKAGLLEDPQGTLWIGTNDSGLNRLDLATGAATHFRHDPQNPNSLSSNNIESVYRDSHGTLWIGTADAGLNQLDPVSGRITRYASNPDDPHALPDSRVHGMHEDRAGTFWVVTHKGMVSLDRRTNLFTRHTVVASQRDVASLHAITTIHEDATGTLWLGTGGAGVLKIDPAQRRLVQYKHDSANPHSLRNNFVSAFWEDPSGTLWVGTLGGGANRLSTRPPKFSLYRRGQDANSVADNFILSLFEDSNGIVWIGNDRTLNRWDRSANTWRTYRNDPADPTSISNGSVTATQEDPDGTLWFGTYNGGLNRFDPKINQFKAYRATPNSPHTLSDDIVRALYRDSSGDLWVGGWNNGLNRFDRATETFRQFRHDPGQPTSLGGGSVTDIYEDRARTLWVATEGGGLSRFDPATETFQRYHNDPKDPASLPDDAVRVLHEDQVGQFWVGTAGGLCAFDRTTGTCSAVYTQKEGLPNDTIAGILEDAQGKLWISTNNGLTRFDPKTKTFRNYDVLDGLQSNEFNVFTAFYKSPRTGEMYFGGINGFNVFHPDNIKDDPFVPPVVLTDFRLFGKSVPVGGNDPVLTKRISSTDALTLPHFQNSLSFEFSALSYVAPSKNQYRYQLEGFDRTWREVGSNERLAVYTGLAAGQYLFRVQGSNEDGVWNDQGSSLKVTITPPWWATWWFICLMLVLLLGLAFNADRLRVMRLKRYSQKLEREVTERTAELAAKNKELEAFSYSVSHDLRAPVRHIDGYLSLLKESAAPTLDQDNLKLIESIASATRRMSLLIDDLLSFSRMGRQEMSKTAVDLGALVADIVREMAPEIEGREVDWHIAELPMVTGDRAMLRVVLVNLISNALKYTQKREKAEITIGCPPDQAAETVVFVRDNGAGFDMQYRDKLFGVFQRLHRFEEFQGTGIGLANVLRIVSRHGGRAWAEGAVDFGATFYFSLPKGKT
ncbi:ligand-binding sensor domain-containing protein/signal transduction histidine kinase [Hydrogenophaga palleronii]|uniref:histidine kinase n=1 Tax=Hydrogenophaga palleronii TaxID=65655 RepID=A0ABU1WGJ5_9BURK|nr:two-component regulator propeller domain-containing protein [Hydrogenophaga palleronii]MDR7148391.1 ligand-binding sensor domain-containing protein/signal transduction histidine kinase [Hydrogenophaga palleronii]